MNLQYVPNLTAAGFLGMGPQELILVAFIVLLLFGAKRLPDLARSFGKSLGEFKRGKDEVAKELEAGRKEAEQAAKSAEKALEEKKGD